MPAFEYKALNASGRQKKGVLEADSPRQVRAQLREQGLTPLEVMETRAKEAKTASKSFSLRRGISASDLALLTRQLSTLVAAALPLEECLKAVAMQCEKPRQKSMLMAIRSRVVEGYPLAESLAEFPHVFDRLFCAMVAAGERSGHLDKVLNRLADYTEQQQQLKSSLMQAMIYPIMLTLVAVGVISILLASVVPKVVSQFEHMGANLPGSTQFLIACSDFVREYGLFVALGIAALIIISQRILAKPGPRLRYDQRIMKVPVVGRVSRGLNTARFARTLAILNASAVPLLEGMRIATDVLTNSFARKQLNEATDRVREGAGLRASLDSTRLFPPMMLHMIGSGEQSGELDQMLERAADNQDKEFEAQVAFALGVFQPALVITMAGVVLFIVMAILEPILALNNMVGF